MANHDACIFEEEGERFEVVLLALFKQFVHVSLQEAVDIEEK